VWPQHDRLVSRPRRLPHNIRSLELPDAGHLPMWDAPDALAEFLIAATAESRALRDPALRRSA
jgi:pimeloyl-ACP methyl ester carboxylesterase